MRTGNLTKGLPFGRLRLFGIKIWLLTRPLLWFVSTPTVSLLHLEEPAGVRVKPVSYVRWVSVIVTTHHVPFLG